MTRRTLTLTLRISALMLAYGLQYIGGSTFREVGLKFGNG
jgi:hypothetical protein